MIYCEIAIIVLSMIPAVLIQGPIFIWIALCCIIYFSVLIYYQTQIKNNDRFKDYKIKIWYLCYTLNTSNEMNKNDSKQFIKMRKK